jgi:hypothetical protein
MDIFAHTLWTAAGAKVLNTNRKFLEKNKGPMKVWWAAFWGVAPDLFAFGFPFLAGLYFIVTGHLDLSQFGAHHGLGLPESASWISDLPPKLYNISHSFVTFAVVFLVVWAIRKRPYYEMLGWALHIAIDIPSHVANFYPTPLFWPVSNWKFLHGVSWGNPTYMIINYSALALVWIFILVHYFRKKKNS